MAPPEESLEKSPENGTDRFDQGMRCDGGDPVILRQAVEAAFDYRGDVTLILEGGEEVSGYVSNRDLNAADPFVEILTSREIRPRRVPYGKIRGVAFTGKNTASGKSWETWLRKYKAKLEALSRGEATEAIGLFPESLD